MLASFSWTLLLSVTSTLAFLDDFSDNGQGYEYVFHNDHDLFLVLHDDKCYFFPTRSDVEMALFTSGPGKVLAENSAKAIIQANDPNVVKASTLEKMRDVFGDVLADFRCANRQIFFGDPAHLLTSTPKPQNCHPTLFDPLCFFAHT